MSSFIYRTSISASSAFQAGSMQIIAIMVDSHLVPSCSHMISLFCSQDSGVVLEGPAWQ